MKILIIGCGAMGSAFAQHFSSRHELVLYDRLREKAENLSQAIAKKRSAESCSREGGSAKYCAKCIDSFDKELASVEVVLLAVKPKDLANVADELSPFLDKKVLLISILAGISLRILESHFPEGVVLRAMPNLAVRCSKGILGLSESKNFPEVLKKKAEEIFDGVGLIVWLPESKLDALTSLTGSGPAFAAILIESMIDAAIWMGFSLEEARKYVFAMLYGTLALLEEGDRNPSSLKWEIASPSGTTICGIKELEKAGVRHALLQAFAGAYERAKNISQETPGKSEFVPHF